MEPTPPPAAISRLKESLVSIALIVLAVVFEYSGIDFWLIDPLWDAETGRWVLADAWWANALLHEGGRRFIQLLAIAAFLVWIGSFILPVLLRFRRGALYFFLSIVLGAGSVNIGKKLTNVDCPWSLTTYGGDRPYVHVFADRPDSLPRGRCFPGGHSSGALSLMSLYFIALGSGRKRPWLALIPGAALGLVYAGVQWGRGAHFPSHDLWTAAICWAIAALLFHVGFGGRITVAPGPADDASRESAPGPPAGA